MRGARLMLEASTGSEPRPPSLNADPEAAEPLAEWTEFDFIVGEENIRGGRCQLQMRVGRRAGAPPYTVDWGDGDVRTQDLYECWHDFREPGTYRIRLDREVWWWRLWECICVTAEGNVFVTRPVIRPVAWSDYQTSCEGTYCGWSRMTGAPPKWGKALTVLNCCYQMTTGLEGPIPAWNDAAVEVAAVYEGCTGLTGTVPAWGPAVAKVNQCYERCAGLAGEIPPWPEACTDFDSTYAGCSGLTGSVPAWPEGAERIAETFSGCTGLTGTIPKWPAAATVCRECYRDCAGLAGAWTDDPAELMPEERFRAESMAGYFCEDVVTGCSSAVRSLFYEKPWGGTKARPGVTKEVVT